MTANPASPASRAIETALTFDCVGTPAVAILHRPERPATIGVAIVVGGPQYRVGGHRQFVDLARDLAAAGFAAFRFDYRGIGDSAAEHPGFPNIAPDIEAAVTAFRAAVPEVRHVAIWALCDAVPAAAQVAARGPGIAGIAAVNPWIRADETHDHALLRHYYLKRPLQRDFWTNLLGSQLHARDFLRLVGRALARVAARLSPRATRGASETPESAGPAARLVADLRRYRGEVLVMLSGQDLTAREFEDAVQALPTWQHLSSAPRVRIARLPAADHTCSGRDAREASVQATLAWLASLPETNAGAARTARPPATAHRDAEALNR